MMNTTIRNDRGVTIIELLVAMVVFSVVLGGAVSTFLTHSRGFTSGTQRMSVLQNVRFTVTQLEADLRTTGAGTPDFQPFIVYASPNVISINSDYTTNVANDIFAIYYDPDAPAGSVSALTKPNQITIPGSSFVYPDTTYANSGAETITFFFRPDSSTPRGDDYALFRQVNADPPELVAHDLLQTGSLPFFEYYHERIQLGGVRSIQQVPGNLLPLMHSAAIEGSAADTGLAAQIDSLRGVRINLTGTNGLTGAKEKTRTLSRLIRLPNAGLAVRKTCGDAPLPVSFLLAAGGIDGNGDPFVNLTWNQAIDETGGEKDAVRYVIWRRAAANPTWGDPYLSIPTGNASYVYSDAAVQTGESFMYQIAVQDCTPSLSSMAIAGPIVVP